MFDKLLKICSNCGIIKTRKGRKIMRTILHSDLNNFYASVECQRNPYWKDYPLCVCGNPRDRHGIILAKNYIAKNMGITTGMPLWQARQICPNIICVIANFEHYLDFSRRVRQIYQDYTDLIEPFGIDEAWLDVTQSQRLFGSGEEIANTIRERIKKELGITASVGVSYNKIFAKLGSDMKKPDATTVITKENFKTKIWGLPVQDLLYVGQATTKKVRKLGIETIGDLANCPMNYLIDKLGVWGKYLWEFANGLDMSPVKKVGQSSIIKSVGNSMTAPKDVYDLQQAKIVITILAESVSSRMRKYQVGKAYTLSVWLRDNELGSFVKRHKFDTSTNNSYDLIQRAMSIIEKYYDFKKPLRSLGISVSDFDNDYEQLSFFVDIQKDKQSQDVTIEKIRKKYGFSSISRANILLESKLVGIDIENSHTIHPLSYFR